MKELLILGAGTSGTMMANHLIKKLPKNEWKITIVDKDEKHYYQPGFLFIPFDIYKPGQVKKSIKIKPDYPKSYFTLGNAYLVSSKFGEAIKAFLKTVSLNPDHAAAHYNLGTLYRREGRRVEAEFHTKKALALDSELKKLF